MKLHAQLDVDVVALQSEDEITCLLTLEAPALTTTDRQGETLILVVDRSGSMRGSRLQSVRTSLHALVDRLKPQDTFGVVTFDDQAAVHIPARTVATHDLPTVHQYINDIHSGGSTNLSGGYLMGLSEARRHLSPTGASIILLSDGQANQGIQDPVKLGALAEQARTEQLTTTTIGIGNGYDETLLTELATKGSGSHRFAFTDDDAIAVVSEEAGDLLNKAIINALARIRPTHHGLIDHIDGFQALPVWRDVHDDGTKSLVIALGDLYAGERRELLLGIGVPALAALGHQHLADITIDYVALPDLVEQTITWPLAVNVVPGDEATNRVPNPTVTTARLLAENTQEKQKASEALRNGDVDTAADSMTTLATRLRERLDTLGPSASEELRIRIAEEADQADKLAQGARDFGADLARKSMMEDLAMESRGMNNSERRHRSRNKRDF